MSADVRITEDVRIRLSQLEREGRLTPAAVVEDAKNDDSPLHGLFEWDTDKAAYRHWLDQARTIIKTVRYIASDNETVTLHAPHYVRDPSRPAKEQGYIAVAELRKDPMQARASLLLEFSRVEGSLTRARGIAVALNLESDIEDLIAQLVRIRERLAA